MRKEEIKTALEGMGLSISSTFVPAAFAKPDRQKAFNWIILVKHGTKTIWRCDYMAGIGHSPTAKKKARLSPHERQQADYFEIQKGMTYDSNRRISPDFVDVMHCLVSDAAAVFETFRDWADNLGYSHDSLEAMGTYGECSECGRAFRMALGADGFRRLQDLFSDY